MLLVQNKKMKSSSIDGLKVFNFGIPAFRSETGLATCPMAGKCAAGCYAKSGAYVWSMVKAAYEKRLKATQSIDFVDVMSADITRLMKNKNTKKLVIRIHDSGDFYSADYLASWLNIMQKFPNVQFYAYTKMVNLIKGRLLPLNFQVIYSFGGKLDSTINVEKDRHSKVFETVEELQKSGYVDVSHDDMLAIGKSNKIGLVYHGNKSFKNTLWNKV